MARFFEWFTGQGWPVWLVSLAGAAVAALAGLMFGSREGAGAVYAGQARTLAELLAIVKRLRRWFKYAGEFGAPLRERPEVALEWIGELERELKDLCPPRSVTVNDVGLRGPGLRSEPLSPDVIPWDGRERRENLPMELPKSLERRRPGWRENSE